MKIFLLSNLFLFVLLVEQSYSSENFLEEQENPIETAQNRSRRSIFDNYDWGRHTNDKLYRDFFRDRPTRNLHCGSKDFTPKLGTTGKWLKNNLTYYIGSYSSNMPADETKRGLRSAFWYWSSVVPLTFTEVANEPADIWIGFRKGEHGDGLPFDGTSGQIAHCVGKMPCTVIHFDDDESWRFVQMEYWLSSEMVDFLSVAMHQIGHALGLGHYDGNENNIMNSRYKRPATKESDVYLWPNLKPIEIKAVKDLYGISTEYPYVGCYIDGKDRLLNNPLWMYEFNEENSVFYCTQICSRDGYRYAGVENGNQCFCGNELNLNTSRKSSDEFICQEYKCPGNNSEFCGGVRAIAVYDTAPQNSNDKIDDSIVGPKEFIPVTFGKTKTIQYAEVGKDARIFCKAQGEGIQVDWLYNGTSLEDRPRKYQYEDQNRTLVISSYGPCQDNGIYTCRVQQFGSYSSINITVKASKDHSTFCDKEINQTILKNKIDDSTVEPKKSNHTTFNLIHDVVIPWANAFFVPKLVD